jgi:hypothetical protein
MYAGKNKPLEGKPGPPLPLCSFSSFRPLAAWRNHSPGRSRGHGFNATLSCCGPAARSSCEGQPACRNRVPWWLLPIVAPTEAKTTPGNRTPMGDSLRPPRLRCRFWMASVSTKRSSAGKPKVSSLTEVALLSCGMRSRGRC